MADGATACDRGWQQRSLHRGGDIGEEPRKIGSVLISRACVWAPGRNFRQRKEQGESFQSRGAWDVFRKLLIVEVVRNFTFYACGRRDTDKVGRED